MKKNNRIFFPYNILIVLGMLWGFGFGASPNDENTFLNKSQKYIEKAKALNLNQNPGWLKLLHYHKTIFGSLSDVDEGYFFLSPKGKTDSWAELEATLEAFFNQKDTHIRSSASDTVAFHPLVKFPARLRFLKKHLGLKEEDLPDIDRTRFTQWRDKIDPVGISLVFVSGYLNNPASAFGHTFLKIHSGSNKQKSSDLLNYVVNYAANAADIGGLSYAYKGIFGGYSGYFSIMPYYVALQKYSSLESRDVWEYKLHFDEEESLYLLEHLWELGDVIMDYYFFTENCSYNMLTVMEVVKPDKHLVDDFTTKVVPIETIRDVHEYPELIDSVIYRPSLLANFNNQKDQLTPKQQELLHTLHKGYLIKKQDSLSLSPEYTQVDSAVVFDVWLDLIQYRKRRTKYKSKRDKISNLQMKILKARSKIKHSHKFKDKVPSVSDNPVNRHGPSILRFSGGRYRSRKFVELGTGMINYDFNSSHTGSSSNLDIKWLDFNFRLYSNAHHNTLEADLDKLHLENFKILEIKSLEPTDFYIPQVSWHFNSGFDSPKNSADVFRNSFMLQTGAGKTFPLPSNLGSIFSLIEVKGRLAPWMKNWHSFGPESVSGLKINFTSKASLLATYDYYYPLTGESFRESQLGWQFRVSPSQNTEVILDDLWHDSFRELKLNINYYF